MKVSSAWRTIHRGINNCERKGQIHIHGGSIIQRKIKWKTFWGVTSFYSPGFFLSLFFLWITSLWVTFSTSFKFFPLAPPPPPPRPPFESVTHSLSSGGSAGTHCSHAKLRFPHVQYLLLWIIHSSRNSIGPRSIAFHTTLSILVLRYAFSISF